ncbi:MAG TPA: pirin family protein [Rubrivivax sp.]|nr:pirin family protein [Rubrivivax sp.]
MQDSFILRAADRGHGRYLSTGPNASYIAGHPDAVLTRQSSFNFHEYQSGRPGFGSVRVFGDEVFSGAGCGYNMHPHHDFAICAFVLQGELTHINTVGNVDQLHAGDYYVFSAGSGGKHSELNLRADDMNAIYIWFLPNRLYLPPAYHRGHFDSQANRNRLTELVGEAEGALPIPQDVRVSRLVSDQPTELTYRPASRQHGVYAFVIEGGAQVQGTALARRDSLGTWGVDAVTLRTGAGHNDLLVVETVM